MQWRAQGNPFPTFRLGERWATPIFPGLPRPGNPGLGDGTLLAFLTGVSPALRGVTCLYTGRGCDAVWRSSIREEIRRTSTFRHPFLWARFGGAGHSRSGVGSSAVGAMSQMGNVPQRGAWASLQPHFYREAAGEDGETREGVAEAVKELESAAVSILSCDGHCPSREPDHRGHRA